MGSGGRRRREQGVSERDLGLGDGLDVGQGEARSACSGVLSCAKVGRQKAGPCAADKSCVFD